MQSQPVRVSKLDGYLFEITCPSQTSKCASICMVIITRFWYVGVTYSESCLDSISADSIWSLTLLCTC